MKKIDYWNESSTNKNELFEFVNNKIMILPCIGFFKMYDSVITLYSDVYTRGIYLKEYNCNLEMITKIIFFSYNEVEWAILLQSGILNCKNKMLKISQRISNKLLYEDVIVETGERYKI